MITRLRQRFTRPVISQDDSGSMLLAMFVMIILTALVSVVLTVTISQQAKTRKATDFTFAGQAADTAVNDALIKANSGALATSGGGVTGDFRWSWSSTQFPLLPLPPRTLEITATGCRNNAASSGCAPNSTRKYKATLSGEVYQSASNSTGEVAYLLSPTNSFNRALFADQDLIMQDSSTVRSYNSTTDLQVPGFGQVATNGSADFGPNVDLNGIFMSNTQSYPNNGRCNGKALGLALSELSQCDSLRTPRLIHEIGPKLRVSDVLSPLAPKTIKDQTAMAPCVQPLKAWVASEAPGQSLPFGIQCYSSMSFDANTSVTGTTANPTKVYVTGPITIDPGVEVNMQATATPAAATLQIFSSGPVVGLGGGDPAARTKVAWALWAPNARCAASNPTGFVTVNGAMVCQKIFTQGAFIAQWDQALLGLPLAPLSWTVWDISTYRDGS